MKRREQIDMLVEEELIKLKDNRLQLSVKGLILSDYVIRELAF
jgi:hypothetical protein